MNPELPRNPKEELEARLTALLLGELSATEAADVRQAIEQDSDLAKLFARLHHTIPLVREAAASPDKPTTLLTPPLKLSDDRRQKLLAQFKTAAPKEFAPERRRDRFTLVELAAVLVILGSLAAISLPMLSPSKSLVETETQVDILRARLASDTARERSREDIVLLQSPAPARGSTQIHSLSVVGFVDADATKQQPATETNAAIVEGRAAAQGPAQRGEVMLRLADDSITVHLPSTAAASVVASPPKIALPPPESSISALKRGGEAVASADNASLGISRGLTMSAPRPISGVPVAPPEFGVAQNGIQESEKNFRYTSDPNPNPPPAPSGLAGAETPAQFSGAEVVDNLALGEELKNNAGPAYRSRNGITPAKPAIPRVAVSASIQDGDGGTDGLGANTATNSTGTR